MRYVFVYFFLALIVYLTVNYEKNEKIQSYLNGKTKNYLNAYDGLYSQYKVMSDLVYTTNINTTEVKDIFAKARDVKEKDQARTELYAHLKETYKLLTEISIKQLHFHLPNNDSFLRFHRPRKFGDNLTKIRETVNYVSNTHQAIDSFEEGRIYNGYRHVYPLFDENKQYLGSVEISFSTLRMNKDFINNSNVDSLFYMFENVVREKVFASEKNNYISCKIKNFAIEKKILLGLDKESSYLQGFSEKTIAILEKKAPTLKSFSIYDKKTDQVLTVIKVQNSLTKKVVGVFVINSNAKYIHNKTKNFYMILFLVNFLIIMILFFMYKRSKHAIEIERYNQELENRVEEKTHALHKSLEVFGENVISSNADLNGVITFASSALCEISGYTKEELIGQAHSIFRHKDMSAKTFKDLWETIEQGKIWNGEIKNRKKNGEHYWVNASIIPEFDDGGVLIAYSSIRIDITAQKAKEEFMANMSHELRTPLNAIIGFSFILNKKQTNTEHKALSTQINTSAISLLTLINDILDLAKIEDSNFAIESFNFNAYNEFISFSQQFEGLAHQKVLHFHTIISDKLRGTFNGDWIRIKQIALNLISNAIKFTEVDGKIDFNIDYKEGLLIIEVADNGIGMTQKVQDKIFKPFEQADGSTTRKYGGTGLGLSITQNLVELMGGKIELESEEGKGTSFRVTILLKKIENEVIESNIVEINEDDKEDSLQGHILIVEDNKTNQMLIRMLVEDFGLTCDMANDGVEATDIYNPQKHALVLMDENMPNRNGLEAMKLLQEKYKEKCGAIIALTANAMAGDKEKFLKAGMDGYIAKPIDEDELYTTLVKFL